MNTIQASQLHLMGNPSTFDEYPDGSVVYFKQGRYFVLRPDGSSILEEDFLRDHPQYIPGYAGEATPKKPYTATMKQASALETLENYKFVQQFKDGGILVDIGGSQFTIETDGRVVEFGKHTKAVKPKGPQMAFNVPVEKKPSFTLTHQQQDLMKKHKEPPIVKQFSNKDLVVKLNGEDWVFGYDGINLSLKEYKQKGYSGSAAPPAKTTTSYGWGGKSPCQEEPWKCKPRQIEHVAWDADHTIWNLSSGIASNISGPLQKIDDDTVLEMSGQGKKKEKEKKELWEQSIDDISLQLTEGLTDEEIEALESLDISEKELEALEAKSATEKPKIEGKELTRITLLPSFRKTLDELEQKGIKSSVISLNTPGTVSRILKAFGLADRFIEIKDTWDNKGKVFEAINKKHELCPCKSIFVDDTSSNVRDVAEKCGLGLQIGKGKDVEKPIEIMKYIVS